MAKSQPRDALLKRLQKIETARARLGEISVRIGTQAEAIADLLKLADAFVRELGAASRAAKAPAKAPAAKRATASAAKRAPGPAAKRGAAPPAPRKAAGSTGGTRSRPRASGARTAR